MVSIEAANQLVRSGLAQKGSLLRTALEKLGLVEVAAAKKSCDIEEVASEKVTAAATIPSEAAIAAGGAASAVAGIPIVGPALAAAAYTETFAMVMGGMAFGDAIGAPLGAFCRHRHARLFYHQRGIGDHGPVDAGAGPARSFQDA